MEKILFSLIFVLFAGLPPCFGATNIYADAGAGMLNQITQKALRRVYVPNSHDGTVSIIDPANYTVVNTFRTGKIPQHIVPSFDLRTLWVLNNASNSLTAIDPLTAKPIKDIQVTDPYNLYFSL